MRLSKTLRLLERLRELGIKLDGGDELYSIKRTYAGRQQRSAGAWSWTLEYQGSDTQEKIRAMAIGSQWPATFLLAQKMQATWDRFGQCHIDPAGPLNDIPEIR